MSSTIENQQSNTRNLAGLDRFGPLALTALAAGLVFSRLWLLFCRLYDPDELEHLHAGFCVWRGMVPYRDFFEQHGPVLWYASLPLFAIWGDSLKVLFAGRFIVWLISIATFTLTWRLANRLYGRWGGGVASLLLALLPAFQEKNIEWRPDNVAVPLVLLAVSWLGRANERRGWCWAGLAGASLSSAFFCTQKVVYVGIGIMAAFVWTALSGKRIVSCHLMLAIVVGAVGVAGPVAVFFGVQGALGSFVRVTILLPLQWKTQEPVETHLLMTFFSAPVFWGLFATGLVLSLSDARQIAARWAGVAVVSGGAAAHALGLLFVPAAFYQYYLPLIPLAAVLGSRTVLGLAGLHRNGTVSDQAGRGTRFVASLVGAAVAALALCLRLPSELLPVAIHPQVQGFVAWLPRPVFMMELGSLCVFAVVFLVGARRLAAFILLATTAIAAEPYLRLQFEWRHAKQTELIQQLMQGTSPEDQFFDGFTGFGALRPHAFSYFWINDHSWPMIPSPANHSGVLAALTDPRTRVVLFDRNLSRHLPADARRIIEENYSPDDRYSDANLPLIVLVRRGRELPDP